VLLGSDKFFNEFCGTTSQHGRRESRDLEHFKSE
jgi:hypothetical protein